MRALLLIALAYFLYFPPINASEANRPFDVHKLESSGLEVWVPARPKWTLALDARAGTDAVIISTPENYFPTTVVEIVLNKSIKVDDLGLKQTSVGALNKIRSGVNLANVDKASLTSVSYGDITGYQNQFDVTFEGRQYTMQAVVGKFSSDESITLLITTPKGQMDAASVMKKKIYKKLSVLQ